MSEQNNEHPNHNKDGKFAKGNEAHKNRRRNIAQRTDEFRNALINAITPEEVANVIRIVYSAIGEAADGKEIAALAKLFFDRLMGPPIAADLAERLDELERFIERLEDGENAEPIESD